ncbi:hypothetical protein OROMI_003469 [Orobanche minor]
MLSNINNPSPSSAPFFPSESGSSSKRKRRPAGTPDPDAEVVSLSPKTLLESDRYVCEICNQGFQRDQNLQMHRRRHKVPWKLLKRETPIARKRVFVCPEPTCLHHDPRHALGDLVGIKKHFRRKHSNQRQWVCGKCSKGYAVQSDYKAHLKTCGTRGHSCDCGRVFSRVESFIEHQDACSMGRLRSDCHPVHPLPSTCLSGTASSPSQSSDTNPSTLPPFDPPNLELELLTKSSSSLDISANSTRLYDKTHSTPQLQLSIRPSESEPPVDNRSSPCATTRDEQLRAAIAEKAYADEARLQAKRQIELAEQEFANAKRIRQQSQADLEKAQVMRAQATKQMNSTVLQITCHSCQQKYFHQEASSTSSSLGLSYISAGLREYWEVMKK